MCCLDARHFCIQGVNSVNSYSDTKNQYSAWFCAVLSSKIYTHTRQKTVVFDLRFRIQRFLGIQLALRRATTYDLFYIYFWTILPLYFFYG